MVQLVGFAGSLRAGSFNRLLLAAAADAMPQGAKLDVLEIADVPLYNADIEQNQGIPGVAKNVIDWISRPGDDQPRVTHGKPVALMGATPGGLGTAFSQAAWLQVLRTLRMRVWVTGGPFYLSAAFNSFDENGQASEELKLRLAGYLAAYVASLSA